MAEGLRCRDCGWQESDHITDWISEPERGNATGFKHSLTTCPGFNPNPKEVRAAEAQRAKEYAWAGTVAEGRARTRTIILGDVLAGRWGKGWQKVARQITTY